MAVEGREELPSSGLESLSSSDEVHLRVEGKTIGDAAANISSVAGTWHQGTPAFLHILFLE